MLTPQLHAIHPQQYLVQRNDRRALGVNVLWADVVSAVPNLDCARVPVVRPVDLLRRREPRIEAEHERGRRRGSGSERARTRRCDEDTARSSTCPVGITLQLTRQVACSLLVQI